eukprot:CAMPEP_0175084752 /NCGR_PEP_ID=MMETSP0052_2-20121109/28248_1 /TAXON_ID=51329 ORGANISM="Polytomella parva, Strain SAG 63-3" /NCGR_SAMPLE_ID=MMETSP0052_2 /ASSEMBLY_ACC=CAM_ASM_000194 /LENGTH=361 /DNA_ID=CAMNT_0016356619 /DNA_START=100 /DNA_END=1185 /DNA_ORIENTATION=-
MEFGFVPKSVINDLQDIGNWKLRASAIDSLQKSLREVSDKSTILPGLSQFVSFLMSLLADPNFKIAISSMTILGDLILKVGKDIEPYLRTIIPGLIEKFSDSKILVRSANMKALKKLMTVTLPRSVLPILSSGLTHSNWRVREEILNTHILVLLQYNKETYNFQSIFDRFKDGLTDDNDKVQRAALEGLAVLRSKMSGLEFEAALARTNLSDDLYSRVSQRLTVSAIASINADGMVEHVNDGDLDPLVRLLPSRDSNGLYSAASDFGDFSIGSFPHNSDINAGMGGGGGGVAPFSPSLYSPGGGSYAISKMLPWQNDPASPALKGQTSVPLGWGGGLLPYTSPWLIPWPDRPLDQMQGFMA